MNNLPRRTDRPGPRGLDPANLVKVALRVIKETGESDFSLRKVAVAAGVNPMTLIHHFGSKVGLDRAMADSLIALLAVPDETRPWKDCLRDLAQDYRRLAQDYPEVFPRLADFYVTGPADARVAEHVYRALLGAGFPAARAASYLLGYYALVIGLCTAEIRGMLSAPPERKESDVRALANYESDELWATRMLLPEIAAVRTEEVFDTTLQAWLDGLI